jgi:hypothetical protein
MGKKRGQTFYDTCQALVLFFSGRLAHFLPCDVGQVVVFIIRFVVSPYDKKDLQPLRSQSSERRVMAQVTGSGSDPRKMLIQR